MKASFNQESARIYQFPPGGRAALGSRRHGETKSTAADQTSPRVSEMIYSDCWYHEEAIRQSEPSWEH